MKTPNKSPLFLAMLLLAALFIIAYASKGQTNPPAAVTVPAIAQPSPAALKVADDVRQLILDLFLLGGNVSWAAVAFSAYCGIKGLRNRTPLGQHPAIGPWLDLLNLEAKQITAPVSTAPIPVAASPQPTPDAPAPKQ